MLLALFISDFGRCFTSTPFSTWGQLASGLRIQSDLVIVRPFGAGMFRRLCILVTFGDMFRVYTYTRTVFEQVQQDKSTISMVAYILDNFAASLGYLICIAASLTTSHRTNRPIFAFSTRWLSSAWSL